MRRLRNLDMTIEEAEFSVALYNKLKRKGINMVKDIPKFDYSKLSKVELIELVEFYNKVNITD
jgi:DNA-directed RNA polymerase alpha subunit